MKEDVMQGEKTVGWVAVLYSSFIRNQSILIIIEQISFLLERVLVCSIIFCLKNWNTLKEGG